MPGFIWNRSPSEARANPYEYEAQAQFAREATAFLAKLYDAFDRYVRDFHRDERSRRKAIWMLQVDAIDTLRDCVQLLAENRHRLVGRLFRDVVETLDLAAYFHSGQSNSDLESWYENEIVPHRRYRDFVKKTMGKDATQELREEYQSFSRLSHRTYRSLAQGYILGADDRIVYEGTAKSSILIPPQTISEYYAILAHLIRLLGKEVVARGILTGKEVNAAWEASVEPESEPRRFAPHLPKELKK
jgi:hypothetical protein